MLARSAASCSHPPRFRARLSKVIESRDRTIDDLEVQLIVASRQEAIDQGRVVDETGPRASRDHLQTESLLNAMHLVLCVRKMGLVDWSLDGDYLRHGLNADLGFSAEDCEQNVRRVGEVALLMADAALTVLVPVISPYESDREAVRKRHEELDSGFVEVFVESPTEVCEERDPKGLYARARAEIRGLTGVEDPYEAPRDPEGDLLTGTETGDHAVPAGYRCHL